MQRISEEVVDEIMSYMPVTVLSLLGSTSYPYRQRVREHLRVRLRDLLSPFFQHHTGFLLALGHAGGVISGSQALSFMVPGAWIPDDMDIYVNFRNAGELVAYLRRTGWQRQVSLVDVAGRDDESDDEQNTGQYFKHGGIDDVITLIKNGKKINVVVSERRASFYPLFHFHFSLVMNFISAVGCFCAYPTPIEGGAGLLNAKSFWPERQPTPKIEDCLAKYHTRGFTVHSQCKVPHRCYRSAICPHTMRNARDGSCLRLEFQP